MTQVLTWIKDHSVFLEKNIQPLIDKAGLKYMDSVVRRECIKSQRFHYTFEQIQFFKPYR